MDIVRRKSDGAVFRASVPEDPHEFARICGAAFADRDGGFYFRRIRLQPRRWWRFWPPRWFDTGEIWEAKSGEFDVASSSTVAAMWGMYETSMTSYPTPDTSHLTPET